MLRAALFVVIPAVPAANTIDRVGGDKRAAFGGVFETCHMSAWT